LSGEQVTLSLIELITLGLISFISTNIDDFLLLLLLFSDKNIAPRKIVLGHMFGMVGIFILSYIANSVGTFLLPHSWIGLLGAFPLLIGLFQLSQKGRMKLKAQDRADSTVAIFLITLANGGDNIAIYSNLFLDKSQSDIFVLIATYLVLAGIWCLGTFFISSQKKWSALMSRFGAITTPFALIVVGLFTLAKLF
jgi:cadmium resistance protein CadD (predicted permease)